MWAASLLLPMLLLSLFSAGAAAEVTNDFAEVVEVRSSVFFDLNGNYGDSDDVEGCTGVFIHPRALLTAAHCVRRFTRNDKTAGTNEVFVVKGKGRRISKRFPSKVHVSSWATPILNANGKLIGFHQDLAILEFAEVATQKFGTVSKRPSAAGALVTFVGITGGTEQRRGNTHFGRNRVQTLAYDTIVTEGSANVCGNDADKHLEDWSTCVGDSGGPMFDAVTGEIIGIASTAGTLTNGNGRQRARHVDLTSAAARKFIESVLRSLH